MGQHVAAVADGRTTVIVRSVHGLEWVCAWEAGTCGAAVTGVRLGRRQVEFEAGPSVAWLLALRTADDAFVKVATLHGVGSTKGDLPALGAAAAGLDWPRALDCVRGVRELPARGSFDVVASVEGRRSYNRFGVERTIGLPLAAILGATFVERDDAARAAAEPDFTVRVFLRADEATVAVRLARRPLHRRAYKVSTGAGTLHPPVAAALVAIGAPTAGTLSDPFCGDGTIAIEAALSRPQLHVVASDIDPARVQNARENADRAGVDIGARQLDAATFADKVADVDAIITNPPWNQAVHASGQLRTSDSGLVDALRGALGPRGVLCCIADASHGLPAILARNGWQLGLEQRIRLAGRVADVALAAPPDGFVPTLPVGLGRCREQALDAGVVTESGF